MAQGQADNTKDTALDVTAEQIARTYAQALLGASGDDAETVVGDLNAICQEVLGKHPLFEGVLGSAFMDHEQRCGVIDRVFGGRVSPVTVRGLKVLSSHGRLEILNSVARQATKLLNEQKNRTEVVVRLASQTDDALLERVKTTVQQQTGVEPILRVEIVPELVGGLEIRIGDTVYDGSLRTAFARAHKAIVQQTVEAIENNPERFTIAS